MTPEMKLSRDVMQVLNLYHIFAFHVPSEGRRTRWEQAQFKINGGRAGISDLILVMPFRVVFVELKAKNSRQSPSQRAFEITVMQMGHEYYTWRSVDDALDFCKSVKHYEL